MHKRFSLENLVFLKFFSLLMVFCLSVSMLWGQDSLPAESQKGDVFIANNSFHVVGNALVLGNIKSIENKEDAKNEKQKQLLVQKKSNDNIKIFKFYRIKGY